MIEDLDELITRILDIGTRYTQSINAVYFAGDTLHTDTVSEYQRVRDSLLCVYKHNHYTRYTPALYPIRYNSKLYKRCRIYGSLYRYEQLLNSIETFINGHNSLSIMITSQEIIDDINKALATFPKRKLKLNGAVIVTPEDIFLTEKLCTL